MVDKKRIAIIPARGGSKRIPDKNIKLFCGKPMIAWTIEAAQQSGLFDRILVSTDSERIAEISRQYGVDVPFLRAQLADDYANVSQVTAYALEQVRERLHEEYENVAMLMPNCPLRTALSIKKSIMHFESSTAPAQISCFKFGWNNPWWAFTLDEAGCGKKLFPEATVKRSQDLPELFCPTGAIWFANAGLMLREKNFYAEGHRFYPIPWSEAIDIDTMEDLAMAESMKKFELREEKSVETI